ncbi:MAG: Do family serine endopeptidase, partial [Bdellovibrionales bacterium]|nr:Do family serine endopeptidase [Bdellovibrionales bacterium]
MRRRSSMIFVLAAFTVVAGFFSLWAEQVTAAGNSIWVEAKQNPPKLELNLPSFAPVIEELGKAVVNISTEGTEQLGQSGSPFGSQRQYNSPFDFFFQVPPQGGNGQRSFKTHSLGSGFVIHPDGLIVTNNHVVDRATKIMVTFKDDKKQYLGKVIGKDRKSDLALIKVDADHPLDAVVVGNSDALRPGDWVIAIGNPFRLGHTVTVGIVSATSRKVPGGGPYDDFIQTDASINPGNSGGPLFNAKGEVVGVNTAIYSPGAMGSTGFNIGIGFAIPIEMVRHVIDQLHDKGKVVRGWLGVLIQPVSEDVAEAMKLEKASGALVADVMPDSPAATAGVKRGDVIMSYDGRDVEENDDLPIMVAETPINKVVDLEVIRAGKKKTLKVKIKELEEDKAVPEDTQSEQEKLGLSVQDLTPDIAKSLGIDDTSGVVVSNVLPGSVAESAGMRR